HFVIVINNFTIHSVTSSLNTKAPLLPGALTKGKMTINHHFPRKRFRGDNKSWQLPAFVQ
ncbi:TPA: hypothetical protein ACHKCS_001141, partial [Escherichia coli]